MKVDDTAYRSRLILFQDRVVADLIGENPKENVQQPRGDVIVAHDF